MTWRVYRELLEDAYSKESKQPCWFTATRSNLSGGLYLSCSLAWVLWQLFPKQPLASPFDHSSCLPFLWLLLASIGMAYTALYATPAETLFVAEMHCCFLSYSIVVPLGYLMGFVSSSHYAVENMTLAMTAILLFAAYYLGTLFMVIWQRSEIEEAVAIKQRRQYRWRNARLFIPLFMAEMAITQEAISTCSVPLHACNFFFYWHAIRFFKEENFCEVLNTVLLPEISQIVVGYTRSLL